MDVLSWKLHLITFRKNAFEVRATEVVAVFPQTQSLYRREELYMRNFVANDLNQGVLV